jgi:putative transposase
MIGDKAALCPLEHINRQSKAPRRTVLWLSDFTYVATLVRVRLRCLHH